MEAELIRLNNAFNTPTRIVLNSPSLLDTFGYCIIPKSTLLYRGHKDKSFDDCMFFGTKHFVGGVFNDEIQVWKTTVDITVLFLVDHLNERSWTTSSLPRLYNRLFPNKSNADFNDLDIKLWDINRRNQLARKLFDEYKISGWLTSLEDKIELEICLFDKQANSKQLLLSDISNRKNKRYFKDSLKRVEIFPAKNFFDNTNEIINERVLFHFKGSDHFKRYRKAQHAWVKDEAKNEQDKKTLPLFYYDLRMKLKI